MVDMQEQASPHGDLVKFANSSFESLTDSRERAAVVVKSKLPPSNPFVYSGPFNSEAARRMGYKTTSEEYASLSSQQRRDQSLSNWQELFQAMVAGDGDLAETVHRRLSRQNSLAALAELDRREARTTMQRKTRVNTRSKG